MRKMIKYLADISRANDTYATSLVNGISIDDIPSS